MRKIYDLLKKEPLLSGILAVAISFFTIKLAGPEESISVGAMVVRIALIFVCLFFLSLISGSKVPENSNNMTGYAMLRLLPTIIIPFGGAIFTIISFMGKKNLIPDLPVKLLILILMMLSVGLFEELCFRAVINDAILYRFRDKKGVFVAIAVISCLVFGMVHVLGYDISTPIAFAQAVLKTLSTGLWGFAFLIVYWKTHNVWACGLMHGIYDILSTVSNYIFEGSEEMSYIAEGTIEAEGYVIQKSSLAIGAYIGELVIFTVIILTMIKLLKSIDFDSIRKEW